jgi:hypothetical protein
MTVALPKEANGCGSCRVTDTEAGLDTRRLSAAAAAIRIDGVTKHRTSNRIG